MVYSGFHYCLKEILIITTQFFLDNYNENQSKLQQWLEGNSTLATSMFSKSHLGLYSGQMLLFSFSFYQKWILIFLVWLVDHFQEISKVQLIGGVSHFHSLSGLEFFSLLPSPPTFLKTTGGISTCELILVTYEHTKKGLHCRLDVTKNSYTNIARNVEQKYKLQ